MVGFVWRAVQLAPGGGGGVARPPQWVALVDQMLDSFQQRHSYPSVPPPPAAAAAAGAVEQGEPHGGHVASLLAALAQARHAPQACWLDWLWAATQPGLGAWGWRELASSSVSATRLWLEPPVVWWDAWLAAALPHLGDSSIAGVELARVLQAAARGGARPSLAWLQEAAAPVAAAATQLTPATAAGACQALGCMARRARKRAGSSAGSSSSSSNLALPHPSLVAAAQALGQALVPAASTSQLVMASWALTQLRAPLPPALRTALMACDAAALQRVSPSHLAHMMASLAKSPAQPTAHWLLAVLAAVTARLQEWNVRQAALLLWALARQRQRPPIAWTAALLAHLRPRLQGAGPTELALLSWALARLAITPPLPWRRDLQAAVAARWGGAGPHALALTAWAVARWGYPGPPMAWKRSLLAASKRVLHLMAPQELAMLAAAAAALGGAAQLSPSDHSPWVLSLSWQRELVRATALAAQHATPRSLAVAVLAMGQMRLAPGRAWEQAVLGASHSSIAQGGYTSQGLAKLGQGLALLGVRPPRAWLEAWYLAMEVRSAGMSEAERRAMWRTASAFREQWQQHRQQQSQRREEGQ